MNGGRTNPGSWMQGEHTLVYEGRTNYYLWMECEIMHIYQWREKSLQFMEGELHYLWEEGEDTTIRTKSYFQMEEKHTPI